MSWRLLPNTWESCLDWLVLIKNVRVTVRRKSCLRKFIDTGNLHGTCDAFSSMGAILSEKLKFPKWNMLFSAFREQDGTWFETRATIQNLWLVAEQMEKDKDSYWIIIESLILIVRESYVRSIPETYIICLYYILYNINSKRLFFFKRCKHLLFFYISLAMGDITHNRILLL